MNFFRPHVTLLAIIFLTPSTLFAANLSWVGCGVSKVAYMSDLVIAYKKESGIDITVDGGGATRGIRDVASGSADLGGSCRFYLADNPEEQIMGFEPLAWDALTVITHKSNPLENITIQQIKDIYSGKITNWKKLGGPDSPITIFDRKGKTSGVGYTIRKLIFSDFNQEFKASKTFDSSEPLELAVEASPNAIGITGISSARHRKVKILKLDGVFPDYKAIKGGKYSLYRPLYIVFNPASPKLTDLKQFIAFAHGPKGRTIMKKNGVVPYMDAMNLIVKQMKQEKLSSR